MTTRIDPAPAYKASLVLTRLVPMKPDRFDNPQVGEEIVGAVEVIADAPARAMQQVYEHATALRDWHNAEEVRQIIADRINAGIVPPPEGEASE